MSVNLALKKVAAAVILAGGLAFAGPAMAQTPSYVGVAPPAIGAVDAISGGRVTPAGAVLSTQGQVAAQVGGQANTSGLAFTGADIAGMTMFGAAAIGFGIVVVRAGRRRSAESDHGGQLPA